MLLLLLGLWLQLSLGFIPGNQAAPGAPDSQGMTYSQADLTSTLPLGS